MKYWTIAFPGEFGQNVQETWSEDQIIESYYKYWSTKMIQNVKDPDLSRERCIEDWTVVHWAVETDQWGNKLPVFPPINTTPWNSCPKCGIKLDQVMGYCCSMDVS